MDVVAREQLDRRRFIAGRRAFWALGASTIALAFAVTPTREAWITTASVAALVVAAQLVTRGADAAPASPDDAREAMRARAHARLRLGKVLRACVVVFGIANVARATNLLSVASAAAAVIFVWAVSLFIEARVRRALSRL